MARILLTIALALSTHGIVMGQDNKVNDETRSVFMNGQRIRTAMGNLIGKNGATKDAEASVDTLTRLPHQGKERCRGSLLGIRQTGAIRLLDSDR